MCSLGVPKVLGDSSVPGAQRAPLPCFVSDLSADVPGGAAICPAAGGRSGEGLWPRILDAGPRGAPTRPGLPDVSRDLCLPPETFLQRKPTDHSLSLQGTATHPPPTARISLLQLPSDVEAPAGGGGLHPALRSVRAS